jgi:LysR family transcriptional regulator, hydrogen peroxide-inducible genes activator
MKMHRVKYFLAVCKERSFTRAAKRCKVAQPSLSNVIQKLEQELGGPLFVRNVAGVTLTRLGHAVRPHFENINQSIELIQKIAPNTAGCGPRRARPSNSANIRGSVTYQR